MSERTAVQNPMLRLRRSHQLEVGACNAKIAAEEREHTLLGGADDGSGVGDGETRYGMSSIAPRP